MDSPEHTLLLGRSLGALPLLPGDHVGAVGELADHPLALGHLTAARDTPSDRVRGGGGAEALLGGRVQTDLMDEVLGLLDGLADLVHALARLLHTDLLINI